MPAQLQNYPCILTILPPLPQYARCNLLIGNDDRGTLPYNYQILISEGSPRDTVVCGVATAGLCLQIMWSQLSVIFLTKKLSSTDNHKLDYISETQFIYANGGRSFTAPLLAVYTIKIINTKL